MIEESVLLLFFAQQPVNARGELNFTGGFVDDVVNVSVPDGKAVTNRGNATFGSNFYVAAYITRSYHCSYHCTHRSPLISLRLTAVSAVGVSTIMTGIWVARGLLLIF